MNSYGDPESAHGRAQVPGPSGGYDYDQESNWSEPNQAPNGGRAPAGPIRTGQPPAGGRASVGRATVGRASVPNSGGYGYDDPSTGGRAGATGRASVGRAAVGAAAAPAAGRATARAAVPVSPGGPMGPGAPVGPVSPGGPAGPGGPTGPKGRSKSTARAKRIRRRNWIISALAIFIMVTGGVVVGGTWYYDDVPSVTDFKVPEATTVLFADGSQLAKLGEANRSIVPISAIPEHVRQAVVSAEDRKFYEHDGVDVQGIARAAWNNLTGGETQGASTITQQYARHAAELSGITYARKIREAVMANKLEQDKSKDEILYYYLNAIYFGRGAHGIEAAAQTYFSVPANKLTTEQAAVLAAVIKQPNGPNGFDPALNEGNAKGRWGYVLDGMVEKKWLDQAKRAEMQYPKVNPYDPNKPTCAVDCGVNLPTGNVINYVREEMQAMGYEDWKDGGYQIVTSINPKMQTALEKVIRRPIAGSALNGQPENLMAALVAVEPSTGRVLAYYGGENGTGTDYAGWNYEGGAKTGGHPAGSSFKIYTLAAGLKEGISMNTYWDASATKDGQFVISNANRTPACAKSCTLEHSTLQSYNVPFYWMTKAIGPNKVVDAAKAAGIKHMWTDSGEEVDLTKIKEGTEVAPSKFNTQVGYGQYGVTVLDHANGAATLAARGVYRPAHFVVEVRKRDGTGQFKPAAKEKIVPQRVFDPNQVDDINAVLAAYPGTKMSSGRPSARKTGTWELNSKSSENGDAWNIGYTPQIAAAVWVGNVKDRLAIEYLRNVKNPKDKTNVAGANLPYDIWRRFMEEAHKGLKVERFPEKKNTGRDDHPAANGASPAPSPDPGENCPFPPFCPPPPGNGGGGPGGGGGGEASPAPKPSQTR